MDIIRGIINITDLQDLIILFLMFVLFTYLSRRKKKAIIIACLALVLAFSSTTLIKELVKIDRPCAGESTCPSGYSFPSTHTTIFFAMAFGTLGMWIFAPYLLIAILIGFSRIYFGVHTPIDIAGGILLAILCFIISKKSFEIIENRYIELHKLNI